MVSFIDLISHRIMLSHFSQTARLLC